MDRALLRRLLDGAETLFAAREAWVPALARTTGLSEAGVRLGFDHLEREVSAEDEAALHAWATAHGPAEKVTVVLSASVFVAAFRALVLARIVAPEVVLRPSRREPLFARALVEYMQDTGITIDEDLDLATVDRGVLHAYGADATLRAIAARARVPVVGHGTGLGVCVVSGEPRLAAEAIARDVVAFDQRGCLSARILWVDGSVRAAAFARALAAALEGSPVARGALTVDERGEARRWMESIRFAGELWDGPSFAVGLMASPAPCLPPPGRHVHIALFDSAADLRAAIAELAPFVTTIGVDAASEGAVDASLVPHARVVPLGTMQRPPLDGPVDRRGLSPGTRSLPVPRGLVD